MAASRIRALIFDFDGLMLDTEWPEYRSWQELYHAHGAVFPHDEWLASVGTAINFDPYAHLARQLGQALDKERIRQERRTRFLSMLAEQPLLPGVEEYIDTATRRGLKLGVASSSPFSWVGGHLTHFGLTQRFTCVKCADDVAVVKPDPALYMEALAALEVAPDEAIAFEDSRNGLRAAKQAGIFCVVVPDQVTKHMAFDEADLRLNSLAELPLEQLLLRVEQRADE